MSRCLSKTAWRAQCRTTHQPEALPFQVTRAWLPPAVLDVVRRQRTSPIPACQQPDYGACRSSALYIFSAVNNPRSQQGTVEKRVGTLMYVRGLAHRHPAQTGRNGFRYYAEFAFKIIFQESQDLELNRYFESIWRVLKFTSSFSNCTFRWMWELWNVFCYTVMAINARIKKPK